MSPSITSAQPHSGAAAPAAVAQNDKDTKEAQAASATYAKSAVVGQHVYMYCGDAQYKGVSIESFNGIKQHIAALFPKHATAQCKNDQIETNNWTPNGLFVLPGGKCSEWEITVEKQRELMTWIENGGRIFAVCAGSYFCSAQSKYKTLQGQIDRVRDMALFPGVCIGPLTEAPISLEKIRWEKTGEEGYVAVMSGGYLTPDPALQSSNYEVLARFEDKRIAVVKCIHKKGVAILTTPHWEFNAESITVLKEAGYYTPEQIKEMQEKLNNSKSFRDVCFKVMMTELS